MRNQASILYHLDTAIDYIIDSPEIKEMAESVRDHVLDEVSRRGSNLMRNQASILYHLDTAIDYIIDNPEIKEMAESVRDHVINVGREPILHEYGSMVPKDGMPRSERTPGPTEVKWWLRAQ